MKMIRKKYLNTFIALILIFTAVSMPLHTLASKADYSQVATSAEKTTSVSVGKYGMLPIYGRDVKDGTYSIQVESSSSMFRVVEAKLTVQDGQMEAVLTLSGKSYLWLYMGTGKEAAKINDASAYIGYKEDADGMYTYTVPVEALDKGIDCAAFSKNKEKWYDRVILFDASSLPEDALLVDLPDYEMIEDAIEALENGGAGSNDSSTVQDENGSADSNGSSAVRDENGVLVIKNSDAENADQTDAAGDSLNDVADHVAEDASDPNAEDATGKSAEEAMEINMADGEYAIEVTLVGGSGKATVNSPTYLYVRDGKAYARLIWSSSNYDYMIVEGKKYLNMNTDGGNSTFEIPITAMDEEMAVIADTTAMGTPHEVSYSLTFYSESIGSKNQMPQEAAKRVVVIAIIIIVGGGILNHILNKKK